MHSSVIETHHLSKLYSRGLYALHDLSLTIAQGEFVFLTGPSGAGKSTFLRLLLMQERPSEGELFVNGQNLAHAAPPRGPGVSAQHRLHLSGLQADSDPHACSRTSRSCPRCSASPRPSSAAARFRC